MSTNPYQAPLAEPAEVPPVSAEMQRIEKVIASQANASVINGVVGFFFFGFILGPFAWYRGSKELRLIRRHQVGHQHSGKATAGKVLGIAFTLLHILLIALVIRGR